LCALLLGAPAVDAQPGGSKGERGPVPVTAVQIARQEFSDQIEALGTTRANETVVITAKLTETVKEIHFDDGQTVRKGDVLVVLDSDEENADLRAAQAQAAERRSAYKRAAGLEEKQIVSRATYEEKQAQLRQAEADIQSIRSRIADTVIRAPFDGVLGLRNVSVGTLVRPGDGITTIDDLTRMKVDFDVPAIYLQQLRPGLAIAGTVDAFGDRVFSGEVTTIDTQVDPVTRSVKVRAIVPNPDMALRPGLLMNIRLDLNPRQSLVVPEGAVTQQKDKSFVYVIEMQNGKEVAKKTEVVRGARRLGEVEIISGLEEGDTLILAGGMNVAPGQEVKVVEGLK
jgi:membrane fusion protein (multidrug efflux system)